MTVAEATVDQSQGATERIIGFDYLRIAAVFAVVWIHGSDTNPDARGLQVYTAFAVPCFVLMAAFLTQESAFRRRGLTYFELLSHRLIRLLPAYFTWSAVYLAARYFKHAVADDGLLQVDWLLAIFGGGASYQLWFVPALLAWIVVFGSFVINFSQKFNSRKGGVMLIIIGITLLWMGHALNAAINVPDNYSLITKSTLGNLGYFPIGLGMSIFTANNLVSQDRMRWITIIIMIVLMAAAFIAMQYKGLLGWWWVPASSLALFMSGILVRGQTVRKWTGVLSTYAFGIYLVHALFVEGLQLAARLSGIELTSFMSTVTLIFLAFGLSAALCVALGRTKTTRWLVM